MQTTDTLPVQQPTQTPAQPHETLEQRLSDAITSFCGKMLFVYVHAVIFAAWIITKGFGHDTFPFNFLTMAVSLEAIFLSTFILISQNRQQAIAEAHNDQVQSRLQQMVTDLLTDEKFDLKNEDMLVRLLDRLDVEHVRPIAEEIKEIHACIARLEARGGAAAGS